MFPSAGFLLSAAFIFGVALYSSGLFLPIVVCFAGMLVLVWIWTNRVRVVLFGVLCILVMLLAAARIISSDEPISSPPELADFRSFTGTMIDVPRVYPSSITGRVSVDTSDPVQVWAQLPPYPAVKQGDRLEISGSFISDDASGHLSYPAQHDTAGVLIGERVSITGNEATRPQRWRIEATEVINAQLRERIPEPAGAFAAGVLIGNDGAMTESTRYAFRISGLTHMTVISGLHVGLIATVLLVISRLGIVNRWVMLAISVPLIWSFAYLVGMGPSVVRACIMLTLLTAAYFLGRPRDTLTAVGVAAALMLLIQPSFRHDIGFQLSVAATTGIAIAILLVGRRSHWHLVWAIPVTAQLATEPLILYHFGQYSLVSPFANMLATPFLAITMAMSIGTVAVSFVSSTLADVVAIATWAPAYAVILIAEIAASIPYLSGEVRSLSLEVAWFSYAVLIATIVALFIGFNEQPAETENDFSLLYRV